MITVLGGLAEFERHLILARHEFRKYADECLAWAKTAQSDKDSRDFLRMAEAWLHAAAILEQPPPPTPNATCKVLIDPSTPLWRPRHSVPRAALTTKKSIHGGRGLLAPLSCQ